MNIFVKARPIVDEMGKVKEGSITVLEKVNIGGVDQHILIRGEDVNNPVLLMVHGGPGQSEIYMSHLLNGPLEKHFTIVNWDQRGAAKSFSRAVKPETMNLDQLLRDAEELIQYLQKRLKTERFYLHGHSFGTILGMLMVNRYPNYFHCYVGVAQSVGLQEDLMVSYEFVMRKAKEAGNKKAIEDLESIGQPPFKNFSKGLWKYSLWLEKFGGKTHSKPGRDIFKSIFSAPEYSLLDKINFFRGSLFSVKHLHQELLKTDLKKLVRKVDIPVYFFLGKHDYSVPFELAENYFKELAAPKKEIVWFEQSGHLPQYEETENYQNQLLRVLLKK
ncbi:alpha/beta hydrolase [Neobacillus sp. DY30]|uniref:alpha/beta fold hydrolase n=1 Tax=Neobacillus sp. DY30 TaxID=3047871 RepID=UPI0024C0CD76|nr:alpha/beta hydrolase [Neobacillus sp. DY30]WHY01566.1 alpha/beta hydrolase [Neobacillus sp. DY30]